MTGGCRREFFPKGRPLRACLLLREPSLWAVEGTEIALSTRGGSSHHPEFFKLEENFEIIVLPVPLLRSRRDEENDVQGHLVATQLEPRLLTPPPGVLSRHPPLEVLQTPGAGCRCSSPAGGERAGAAGCKSRFWEWISGLW